MVHIDMNKAGREMNPGIDLWEIQKVELKTSRKGDQMLGVQFFRVSNTDDVVFDNIMLGGAGWGLGKSKLAALVPAGFAGDLDPLDLHGKRLWLSTGVESYKNKEGKTRERLSVQIDDLKCAGYQPEDDVPEGCEAPPTGDDAAVPF